MISRDIIKSEIDTIQDQHIEVLYHIIRAFKNIPEPKNRIESESISNNIYDTDKNDWISFVKSTYGCLSDDPIERGDQGEFEVREIMD